MTNDDVMRACLGQEKMTHACADKVGHQLELFTDQCHTLGDLRRWLNTKPSPKLFHYMMYGTGDVERLVCFNILVGRERSHDRP